MVSKLPWQETDRYSEQKRFVEQWLGGAVSVSELCAHYGISRKTGYKRIARYRDHGLEGLGDLSRAPHSSPNRTSDAIIELLVAARMKHPTWGPKKLVAWLGGKGFGPGLPAPSTAGEILRRAGLVRPRRRLRNRSPGWAGGRAEPSEPGRVWCADLKGWFRTGDGERCNPFTLSDAASRYLLSCQSLGQSPGESWHEGVKTAMERAFQEHGLPDAVRTDNGAPFASTAIGGLTKLSAWWVKLGIIPERIDPGHPEQNGRHERMHRTLKAETASPPNASARAQQKAFDRFRKEYNEERPHEALGQSTPASKHHPGGRPYPTRVPEPEYSGPDTRVRRVRSAGDIKWKGDRIYLSAALTGEPVGLRPVGLRKEDEGHWAVLFGPLHIGILDERSNRIYKTAVKVLPMSPV